MASQSKKRKIESKAKGYPYKNVHALLINWEGAEYVIKKDTDKIGAALLCYELSTITHAFIPSLDSGLTMGVFLGQWIQEHSSSKHLLIVCYGGHGGLDVKGNLIFSDG